MIKDIKLKHIPILIRQCIFMLLQLQMFLKSQDMCICIYCQTNNDSLSKNEFKLLWLQILRTCLRNGVKIDYGHTHETIDRYEDMVKMNENNHSCFYFMFSRIYNTNNISMWVNYISEATFHECVNDTIGDYANIYKVTI